MGNLVLSRNESQAIFIGDDITVRITAVRGKQVKLSIEAPDDIVILREELEHYDRDGSNGN